MNVSEDPFLGKTVRGYRLEVLLGRGAISAVYRARAEKQWQTSSLIATIFTEPPTLSAQARQRFRERFMREAERLEALRHPNILPLYGYGELEGYYYLLTADVAGETLQAALKRKERWSLQEILFIITPIVAALEYLHHQGQAYKFFNASHVLLLDNKVESAEPVSLTGVGLIPMLRMQGLEEQVSDPAPYAHLKSIAGTYFAAPEYLAPEIVKGKEGDSRSDVYALGVLLFIMLSGYPPFKGEDYVEVARQHVTRLFPSLHDIAPELPVALELVINHALHRDPASRFQHPQALLTAYTHVINERIQVPQRLQLLQRMRNMRAIAAPAFAGRLHLLVEPAAKPVWEEQPYEDDARQESSGRVTVEDFESSQNYQEVIVADARVLEHTPLPEHEVQEDLLSLAKTVRESPNTGIVDGKLIFDANNLAEITDEKQIADNGPDTESLQGKPGEEEAEPEKIPVSVEGAHEDIATMATQIQQLKERLRAQAKSNQNAQEAFPEWLK